MKLLLILLAAAALQPVATAASIPVSGSMTYTQNFDSLGTGSPVWADDSTLPGWYVQISEGVGTPGPANATDGNGTVFNGLLNCGTTGAADRALGSKCTSGTSATSSSNANISFAVSFHNTGVTPVTLAALTYTGEYWRTGSVANTPDHYSVFYQVSSSPVTNIHSGGNAATAQPGLGFTAMDPGANWTSPLNPGVSIALDGNAIDNRSTVNFLPGNIEIGPGKYLTIKWTDPNESDTDGYQAIDDVSVRFSEVSGLVDPAVTTLTRNTAGTDDPTDDTFGFTLTVAGAGSVSAGWTTTDANPPAGNATAANYGVPVVWAGFPIASPKTIVVRDALTASLNASFTVNPPSIIGSNDMVVPGTPLLNNGAVISGWALDETARTMTQNAQTTQEDHVILSDTINLSGTGFVAFTCDLDAISGSTSGFEAADYFSLDLIIDGGTTVSVLGVADVNGDGKLSGAASAGTELQDNTMPGVTKSFSFSYLIPDTANSVQIRITGNSNSTNETYLVKNMKLSGPPATLFATPPHPATILNNKGTVDASDDDFSAPVTVEGANLGASTGWHSDETPSRTGLYSASNPVTFGPYSLSGGARSVTLTDNLTPAIVSQLLTFDPPAAPALTVSTPLNVQRHENGPGAADDTVTFDVLITGARGGPRWSATGATPDSGQFSGTVVTFTFPAPATGNTMAVTVSDASYPAATQTVNVTFPPRYTFGQVKLGGNVVDLASDTSTVPAPEWANDPVARTLTMTAGIATDSIVTSEVINLSSAGDVQFSAKMHLHEISIGSNIENTDRFKAELIIDGITHNLVSQWDAGDGNGATVGTGLNGPPNGYINGYQGAAGTDVVNLTVYPDAATDYFTNKERDEFNLLGQPVTDMLDNEFPLSFSIPAAASSTQLKIYGTGFAGSETVTVSDVLFTDGTPPTGGDTDHDGVSDTNEAIMGTDPNNAADVLRLTQNPSVPTQIGFPSKAGRFYRVYASDDTDGQEATHLLKWKDTGLSTIAGDGGAKQFTVTLLPAEKRRFYRLHIMTADGPWPATAP